MKTIVNPSEVDSALTRWRGARIAVWLFHPTHKRLMLRLMHSGSKEDLYVLGVRCERISGPFAWKDACLQIEGISSNDLANTQCKVLDANAGFELLCSSVVLVIGPANEFGDSMVEFISRST